MAESLPEMEKIEAEKEFYGFSLDSLKTEFANRFRAQVEKRLEHMANQMVEAAKKQDPNVATKLTAENVKNLVEPEIKNLLAKENAVIDKYFTIPNNMPLSEQGILQGGSDLDNYEKKINAEMMDLKTMYIQQAVMIQKLKAEIESYERLAVTKADGEIIDSIESMRNDPQYANMTLADIIERTVKDSDDEDATLVDPSSNLSPGEDNTLVDKIETIAINDDDD